ncbi:MMPL family transporter [Streptacidiphilus pinicola]|uniref:MMPL family transporter n=1 Tax=Streptacidiphilus pinicola TaxID=2219663 RepID=UPI001A9E482C|nr:MMPL family transporter [Streptacidiphilus pinicola]
MIPLRWPILIAALLCAVLGALGAAGGLEKLISGGFSDPGSDSARVAHRVSVEFNGDEPDLLALYSSATATVDDPSFRERLLPALDALRGRAGIAEVADYYDAHDPALVSRDRHATYAVIRLAAADPVGKARELSALRPELAVPGLRTRLGGQVAIDATADAMTMADVARGEKIALVLAVPLLVVIFGGLVAAGMPVLVGGIAVVGALAVTRWLAAVTLVSVFAVNTITLLGLGMAIDYSLLFVGRFREELRSGWGPRGAIARTMSSAGRTVLLSGLTVTLALASMLVFPEVFLRSMALGGAAAVVVAMLAALTVLPAALAVLGHRINALRVPLPRRSYRRRMAARGGWERLGGSVMRRPWRYVVASLVALTVLTLPFLHVRFGGADERVLPAASQARVVPEAIAADFPRAVDAPVQLLVEGAGPGRVREVVDPVRALPDVLGVQVVARHGADTLLAVGYPGARTGRQAYGVVRAVRRLSEPGGVRVLVGGAPAEDVDRLAGLGRRLPWMLAILVGVTLVPLFAAFRSVLLPLKAVAMNLISIGASFGVMVWVFQDGHLSRLLGFTPTGVIEPTIPILVFAVLFGLATDYEIFLLSRVREAWEETRDTVSSVALGLERTGRIITTAALLLVVVVAGFAAGDIVFVKLIGVGMITAIVVDVTLVRALLVPATMRLLGRWNWWAPGRVRGRPGGDGRPRRCGQWC